MSAKGKPKAYQYDEVANNQNWRDAINKQAHATQAWVKKWGCLAVTEDGEGFQTNKERGEKLQKQFDKLSEGKAPVGYSTTYGELGSGRPIDNLK
eukprot:g2006.t1